MKELSTRVLIELLLSADTPCDMFYDYKKELLKRVSVVEKANTLNELILIDAVQKAYRKHCLNDESIGRDELGEVLLKALCNVMGYLGYQAWIKEGKTLVHSGGRDFLSE